MSKLPPILGESDEDKSAKSESMFNLNNAVSLKNPVLWVIIVITGIFAVDYVLQFKKELGPFFENEAIVSPPTIQPDEAHQAHNPNEPNSELVSRAQSGDVEAQIELGKFFASLGWGHESRALAAEWFHKAADQNHIEALFELGQLEPDKQTQWFRQAAKLGHAPAQHRLAVLLSTGEEGKNDPAQAIEWWRKAARGGNGDAQYMLGTLHRYGKLVKQDPVTAHAWLKLATKNKHTVAAQSLKAFETDLTPAQIAKSAELAPGLLATPQ